jgi:hypothetical protein
MHSTIPSEFIAIGLDASRFKKAAPNEYHGPCLRCGGTDRFVIFTDRQFPSWWYFCRVCTPEGDWIDKLNPRLQVPLTPEQKREYAQAHARQEQERREQAAKTLERFTTAELWAELNRRMTDANRRWWESRGVISDWQNYLQLGYTPDKQITHNGEIFHTPAYTIPYLRDTGKPVTMQYRLVNPPDPKDKYRFEFGLSAAWYAVEPYDALTDQAVVCEGAIKAMVTKISGGMRDDVRVFGVPSKSAWAGLQDYVKPAGRVWIILDPDGTREAVNLARAIGKAARVVELPGKIDDMLLAGELGIETMRGLFKTARKVI